jgi:hypothetical protein
MDAAEIAVENIIDERVYHTIKEVKNGQGLLRSKPTKAGCIWLMVFGQCGGVCGMYCICL